MSDVISVSAGQIYANYLKEQLEFERNVTASLESRGTWVITSSGALVSLLLGVLTAVVPRVEELPRSSAALLACACALFVAAAVAAIGVAMPQPYVDLDPDTFEQHLRTEWEDPASSAEIRTTVERLDAFRAVHRANSRKGLLLLLAAAAEVAAVATMAIAAFFMLLSSAPFA